MRKALHFLNSAQKGKARPWPLGFSLGNGADGPMRWIRSDYNAEWLEMFHGGEEWARLVKPP
jgi:hypothetical protein